MSEPEIARRCLNCGAAVRERAAFCPQCGEELEERHTEIDDETEALSPDHIDSSVSASEGTVTDGQQPRPSHAFETKPLIRDDGGSDSETQPLRRNATLPNTTITDLPSKTIAAAPPRPRNKAQAMGRVEKLRKVSSVMIDQAAYDPSLRFLLVAAVLFLIFLVLMILSKVLE